MYSALAPVVSEMTLTSSLRRVPVTLYLISIVGTSFVLVATYSLYTPGIASCFSDRECRIILIIIVYRTQSPPVFLSGQYKTPWFRGVFRFSAIRPRNQSVVPVVLQSNLLGKAATSWNPSVSTAPIAQGTPGRAPEVLSMTGAGNTSRTRGASIHTDRPNRSRAPCSRPGNPPRSSPIPPGEAAPLDADCIFE